MQPSQMGFKTFGHYIINAALAVPLESVRR